jgi:hypothetical protein
MMKNVEFMTAEEKQKVLRQWNTFIKFKFQRKHFKKALYDHLHLNCSFIAHYNLTGFYETYFTNPEGTVRFLNHFNRKIGTEGFTFWINDEDYKDLNIPMCELVEEMYEELAGEAREAQKARDLIHASQLAEKWGWTIVENVQPEDTCATKGE